MARCCGDSANTKIEAGRHVQVTGTGSAHDPFVIAAQTHLTAASNDTFNIVLTGTGTLESPWGLQVFYAATASLDDLPDVDAPAPTNGQVLGWDDALQQWTPRAATTAAPGAVTVGNGVTGDGSVGNSLRAVADSARYIQVSGSGIGLSDAGLNRLVRVFANSTARDSATPAPVQGTLSLLEDDPSVLWYFNGADWVPGIEGMGRDIEGQLLSTSGAYDGGAVTKYIRQVSATTDGSGAFVAISASDLTDYSGVLSVNVTPTGTGTAWAPMVVAAAGVISVRAKRLSDGAALTGATVTCVVEATLY